MRCSGVQAFACFLVGEVHQVSSALRGGVKIGIGFGFLGVEQAWRVARDGGGWRACLFSCHGAFPKPAIGNRPRDLGAICAGDWGSRERSTLLLWCRLLDCPLPV